MDMSVKIAPEMPNSFEIPTVMGPDDKDVRSQLAISHPLEKTEAKFAEHQLNLHTGMIRQHHGLGAQLRFMMELNAVNQTGRLPFLKSSNASRDALLGNDEILDPCDVFGAPEFSEKTSQPHAVMEKRLGIL